MMSDDEIEEFEDSDDPELPYDGVQGQGVGVEIVEEGEFDFLDGVSELAALQSELFEVRGELSRRRSNGQYVPLKVFRSHCHNSLSVSDVQASLWCEKQLEYRYLYPHMQRTSQWKRETERGREIKKKTVEMKTGSDIHQKKELEVHVPVVVRTVTREDKWAIRLLNTYNQLSIIKEGKLEREISVFGELFDVGVLLNGIVDQLQYCKDKEELIVTDLKTRRTNTLPSRSQVAGHKLQVMIYKMLLDGLTRGESKMDSLVEHLRLNRSTRLTNSVTEHICVAGLRSIFTPSNSDEILCEDDLDMKLTFGDFIHTIGSLIRGLDLPPVNSLTIYYEHQGSNEVIGVQDVAFDESWVREMLESSVGFWRGKREATGPDIEDLDFKCVSCQFKNVCVWRKQKTLERSPYAKVRDSPSKSSSSETLLPPNPTLSSKALSTLSPSKTPESPLPSPKFLSPLESPSKTLPPPKFASPSKGLPPFKSESPSKAIPPSKSISPSKATKTLTF